MPKIDTTKISGFDEMTAEDKVAALLAFDIPEEVDMSTLVSKTVFDKVSSELAEAKRTAKSKMSEEEAAKAESVRAHKELEDKYNALLEKSTVSDYKARYLAQGYDEKLAEATAKALYSGDMETVFANSEKFRVAVEQKVKAEVLKDTPKPSGAGGSDKDKPIDIAMAERLGKTNAEANKLANSILSHYVQSVGGN